jgi:Subunit ChlI of Mg-chelatase
LFDVAIVAAVLAAQGVFRAEELRGTVLLGELGLDGRLRPIRGILPATLAAQQAGFTRVIVPLRQAGEAKLVEGIEVFGIASITLGNALVDLIRPTGRHWGWQAVARRHRVGLEVGRDKVGRLLAMAGAIIRWRTAQAKNDDDESRN